MKNHKHFTRQAAQAADTAYTSGRNAHAFQSMGNIAAAKEEEDETTFALALSTEARKRAKENGEDPHGLLR